MGGTRLVIATALALVLLAPAASAYDGGTAARGNDGGSLAGDRWLKPAVVEDFRVAPRVARRDRPLRFALTVRDPGPPSRSLRAFVELRGAGRTARVSLGAVPAGRRVVRSWPDTRRLKAGTYSARVVVRVRTGERARSAGNTRQTLRVVDPPQPKPQPAPQPAPSPAPSGPSTGAGHFPVAGPHSLGGEDSRFGAGRGDHIHQGQDISAAEGTPVVAPRSGTVVVRANQPEGAGNYLVVRGDRDYVFMHLQDGSLLVGVGDTVQAGQRIASVGNTGSSSGPHLHFEIWEGAWQTGGHPIDPLPDLRAWGG